MDCKMFYFQTGLLTAQNQLLLGCLPSFSVPEKLAFPKLLRALSCPLSPAPAYPQCFPSRLWTCCFCHIRVHRVHELPAAFGAAGSACCMQGARPAEAWRRRQSRAGGLPCWEVGCHLSLEGWTFVGIIGHKLRER